MEFKLNQSFARLALICLLTIPTMTFAGDLSIISSDRDELRFSITLDPERIYREVTEDSALALFDLVQIGIPYGATVSVTDATGGGRAPMTLAATEKDLPIQGRPLVELSQPYEVRGRQLVTMRINPAPSGSLYQRVDITLRFTGGPVSGDIPRDPWFNKIFAENVVNFEQFITWPVPAPAQKQTAVTSPFVQGDEWYKISVNQTGLCRVTGSQLATASVSLDDLTSDAIRLYNGGGRPLPYDNDQPRPQLTEVAIIVNDGGDGQFDSGDHILFYAEGPDRWVTVDQTRFFQNNAYDDKNVYWLTIGGTGLRMAAEDVTPTAGDTTISTFERSIHIEQDNLLRKFNSGKILDYFTWYWTNENSLTFFSNAPGRVPGDSMEIKVSGRTFDPYLGDPDRGFMQLQVNGTKAVNVTLNQFNCIFRTDQTTDGSNMFALNMWGASDIQPYLNSVELTYNSYLTPGNDRLDLPLGSADGLATMAVNDYFQADVTALRIDDPLKPTQLTEIDRSTGSLNLTAFLQPGAPNHFYFEATSKAFGPIDVERAAFEDLRLTDRQADVIIVTSEDLRPALDDYVAYRSDMSIKIATVDDIMDNFSYGLYDPTAIRDYLKFAFENYPAPGPHTAILVGDGTYDYLNLLQTNITNIVPPYLRAGDESASDDNYVYFGRYGVLDSDTSYIVPDQGFDMMVARWPVRSSGGIETIVEKIKSYESAASLGSWRSKITIVADDERGQFNNETFHVVHAEQLEDGHIPRALHRNKIYLWEYPFVGREKPAVNEEIVRTINQGTVLIDYIGHGNPDVWAHERVFSRDGDLPRLNNYDRMPLFYAASCAIGFFDDPDREGMGEELLTYPSGGAIAVISAARLVYASDNATFNRKVFDLMLYSDSLSMCEALFLAKVERQYGSGSIPVPVVNDRAYAYFGGPFVRLGLPRLNVQFDTPPDSLIALGNTRLTGTVRYPDGSLYTGDGTMRIDVYDSDRQKTFRLINASGVVTQRIDYDVAGPTIFRGTASITGGNFDFEFVTPLDVSYGGIGARVVAYAELSATDALGIVDSLVISDSIAANTDQIGPEIAYWFTGRAGFTDGGVIMPDDVLELIIRDSSGINLAGGLGHGITLVIDSEPESTVDLTERFEYQQDDYTQGSLQYALTDLSPGRHTFKIKAWDNANNSASVEFAAEIQSGSGPTLVDLLNFPNPMQESTRFTYTLTRSVERLLIEIFTLSGRKIRTFESYPTDPGYYDDIVWYGDDFAGDRVATGVYIFKATAWPSTGGETVEEFGKIVVVN